MPFNPKYHSEVCALLDSYLARTPTAREVDPLIGDLRRLHPQLLSDSLREAIAVLDKDPDAAARDRLSLLGIYNRKTKEMAALYPIMFGMENAIRIRLAETLFHRFRLDDWWRPILHAMRNGYESHSVKAINGQTISRKFANRIGDIIMTVDGERFQRARTHLMTCGSEFLGASTFGQICRLIIDDWAEIMTLFAGRSSELRGMTKTEFQSYSAVISSVRNDLYHHNPISDRQRCVDACALIADHLHLHLGAFDNALRLTKYHRPTFGSPVCLIHDVVTPQPSPRPAP